MAYYAPCPELSECDRLIDEYFLKGRYDECFAGHLPLAEKGYPLAECQIGYFYMEGLGVPKNAEKAFYWTLRAAEHGDRDGQYNLARFYEDGADTAADPEAAKRWYKLAAAQNHELAAARLAELEA